MNAIKKICEEQKNHWGKRRLPFFEAWNTLSGGDCFQASGCKLKKMIKDGLLSGYTIGNGSLGKNEGAFQIKIR